MTFPQTILDTRVELLLSGVWTDISTYVYQRAPVQITRGHPDESGTINPTVASMTLDNRGGRFSPRNPAGPYYGALTRNTQMRLSLPEGGTYLRMEGDGVSYASCPDAAGLGITGDLELQIDMWLSDLGNSNVMSKTSVAGGTSWTLKLLDSGFLRWFWSDSGGGGHVVLSTLPVPVGRSAIKITLSVSTGTVTFYTAPTITGAWTQLGDAVVTGATSVKTSTSAVTIGANAQLAAAGSFNSTPFKGVIGKVYAFKLLNGIGGTVVASPTFTAQSAGTTSFNDAQSNTWTLSGTAEISDRKYRAHTEVPAWPPQWDVTGADVTAPIQGSGRWRRLTAGTPPQASALYRAYVRLTGTTAPVAYWPCEDGANAISLASALGGTPMTFTGTPSLAADSSFLCSQPIPTVSGSVWNGIVPPYTAPAGAANVLRFLMKMPSSSPPPNGAVIASMYTYGTVAQVDLIYFGGGQLQLKGYDATGATLFDTSGFLFGVLDELLRVSVELQTSGPNVQYSMVTVQPGATSGLAVSGTVTGSVGNTYRVAISPGGGLGATAVGHVTVQPAFDSLFNIGAALNAWIGEYAGVRFARLCAEEGINSRIYGYPGDTVAMGAQTAQAIAALLQECEDADKGLIFEPRQTFALGYRTRSSMYNQAPLPLAYDTAQLSAPLEPVDDDRLIINDVTVTRTSGGSSSRNIVTSGPLSVAAPPAGVGSYGQAKQQNLASDTQLDDAAGWLVHLGTVDDLRYPTLSLNLARTALSGVYYQVQDMDIGDRVTASGTPVWLPPAGVSQIVQGQTEVCYGYTFTQTWSCAPESPFEVAVLDDAVLGRLDTDGSTLNVGIAASDQSFTVATTNASSPLWTTTSVDFPFDISIGGERMTVTGVTGTSSPQTFSPVIRAVDRPPMPLGTDGTFESGVADWAPTGGTIAASTAQAHSGTHSGLMTTTGSPSQTFARTPFIAVSVGQAVAVTQWVLTASGTPNCLCVIDFFDAGHSYLSTYASTGVSAPGSWTVQQALTTVPAGAAFIQVGPTVNGSPPAGTAIYVDDVSLAVPLAHGAGSAVQLYQPMTLGL